MSSEEWTTVSYKAAPKPKAKARPQSAWKPIQEVPEVYRQPEEPQMEHYIEGQNWAPVRINKKRPTTMVARGSGAAAAAGGRGPQAQKMRKLDQAEGPQREKRLTRDSLQRLRDARIALQWNQNKLNQECGFPVNTIRDLESTKFQPTIEQLDTLNRVLKLSLTMD